MVDKITHMGGSVDPITHIGRLIDTITQIGGYNIIYWGDRLVQYHLLGILVDTITHIGEIG